MRKIIFKILLVCLGSLPVVSCNKNQEETCATFEVKEHSYQEVIEFSIQWSEVFEVDNSNYFVYFYGINCVHCKNIKNNVISFALKFKNVYFCMIPNDFVNFSPYSEETIGLDSIEFFTIVGTPSLGQIVGKKVEKNISGESKILKLIDELTDIC